LDFERILSKNTKSADSNQTNLSRHLIRILEISLICSIVMVRGGAILKLFVQNRN